MIDCNKCANRCGLKKYYEQRGEHIVKCPSYKPQTNADIIRSMSDKQLATFLQEIKVSALLTGRLGEAPYWDSLEWLKSPADKEDSDGQD